MEETPHEVEVKPTPNERTIGMDGTSFSKGPSKPVPLKPRPRTRPNSTPTSTDGSVSTTTNEKPDRSSAPPNIVVDELDSATKDKKRSLNNFKKLFKMGKNEKKGTNDTINESEEK